MMKPDKRVQYVFLIAAFLCAVLSFVGFLIEKTTGCLIMLALAICFILGYLMAKDVYSDKINYSGNNDTQNTD